MGAFRLGDKVILVASRFPDEISNPRWGGRYGHVIGSISKIGDITDFERMVDDTDVYNISVKWQNMYEPVNDYNQRDLEKIDTSYRVCRIEVKTKFREYIKNKEV